MICLVLLVFVIMMTAMDWWGCAVASQEKYPECPDCTCYTQPVDCICNDTLTCEYRNNNIQAPHNEIEYYATDNAIIIKNVKDIGKLFGYSMQPAIFSGNSMIGVEYDGQKLKDGMIIRYKRNDKFVVHRIKGCYEEWGYVTTQGDNTEYTENVDLDQITDIIVGVIFT